MQKIDNPSKRPHKWRFFRSGGFDHVRLESGADLLALDQLDPKLWAALSCPTHRLHLDDKTLELMDTDRDGRIRVPEILVAVQWAGSVLKNPDNLTARASSLPLSAIDDSCASRIFTQPSEDRNDEGRERQGTRERCRVQLLAPDGHPVHRFKDRCVRQGWL
jgi:hypothetical protein